MQQYKMQPYHTHTHTRTHSPNVFEVEHICYWSQIWDGRISPAQKPAKVNCELLSQY
jgi:hypothetical protein